MGRRYVELPGQEPRAADTTETINPITSDKWEIILPDGIKRGPSIGFGTKVLLNGQPVTSVRSVEINVAAGEVTSIELDIIPANLIISYAPPSDKSE